MKRMLVMTCLFFLLPMALFAQDTPTWSLSNQGGNHDGFLATSQNDEIGLGVIEIDEKEPPIVSGCLMDESALIPLWCVTSMAGKPLPEGFILKNDPDASLSEPRHCVWWVEKDHFIGRGGRELCLDGFLPEEKPKSLTEENRKAILQKPDIDNGRKQQSSDPASPQEPSGNSGSF